jgi:hypothetical protein
MKKFLLASFLTAASATAFASTVTITFTSTSTDVSGNGTTNSQASTLNGETVATIAGFANQLLVCDDFDQTTYVPSSALDYSVNTIASLTTSPLDVDFSNGTLPGGTVGAVSQTQAYDTVAVLTKELEASGNTVQQITDYQYAIWYLMEPAGVDNLNSSIRDNPLDTAAANDLTTAYNDVRQSGTTNMTAAAVTAVESSLVIYTPTSANSSNQEFVGLNTPVSTPEPSSWLLMAALGLFLGIPQVRSRLGAVLSRS